MRPSRPSTSNPNASYRATTPTLIDFLAIEREEQQVRANAHLSQNPLSELGPRRTTHDAVSSAMANAGPSAAPHVTIITIQRYLLERGHLASKFLEDSTIQACLDSANISAESLLVALNIAHDACHPLLVSLGVCDHERADLIFKLAGIVNNKSGFRNSMKTAAQNANNNPEQLIENILNL